MAADAWVLHDAFKELMGDNTVDMDNDTFKMALFQSTSNAATTSINTYATLTNEVTGANGYTTGGVILTGVTWAQTGGTVTFDSNNASWTASGGSIVARFAVIYDDTDASKTVVCHSLLDNTPADVTVADGNTLNVNINASGIFTGT